MSKEDFWKDQKKVKKYLKKKILEDLISSYKIVKKI